MASYNAGIVTAYGAAVRGGYTGTYEQFCSQQANYAQTAAEVEHAKQDAQAAVQQAQDIADSIPEDYSQLSEDVSNLKEDYTTILDSAYVTDTASGSIASFPDGADNVPVKSLTVNVEPVQSGSGDPSPTNIRPISGRNNVTVYRTVKNILRLFVDGYVPSISSGALVESVGARSDYIPIEASSQYTLSVSNGSLTIYAFFYDATKAYISYQNGAQTLNISTPNNARYVMIRVSGVTSVDQVGNAQLEKGNVATSYEEPTTYPVNLGQTVYGGTLDVTTGVLTVDRAYYTTTLSTKDNIATGAYYQYIFYSRWTGGYTVDEVDADASIRPICNIAPYLYSNAQTSTHFYVTSTGFQVFVPSDTAETTAVEIAYFIKKPQTIQLTAQEVRTLLGTNNVFADCGNVSVEYRADTKLYINKVLNT